MKFYLALAALVGINAIKLTTEWDGNSPYYQEAGKHIDAALVPALHTEELGNRAKEAAR